jgi:hypothetical protein
LQVCPAAPRDTPYPATPTPARLNRAQPCPDRAGRAGRNIKASPAARAPCGPKWRGGTHGHDSEKHMSRNGRKAVWDPKHRMSDCCANGSLLCSRTLSRAPTLPAMQQNATSQPQFQQNIPDRCPDPPLPVVLVAQPGTLNPLRIPRVGSPRGIHVEPDA